ncbi:MAG: CocE/NonD family hydrolase [Pseudomonadota bacterium]
MSDSAAGSPAWRTDPHAYLARRPAEHALVAPRSRYLTMRDGVRLACDLHLPGGGEGPWPVVVIFTPYYRRFVVAEGSNAEPSPNIAIYRDMFVPRGYALLVVDARGSGASFGCRDSFRSPAERADAAEVIAWVAEQPWCDGHMGSTGISYLGASACFAAASGHPALKAIAPISAVWDSYRDHFYPGGCRLSDLIDGYGRLLTALDHDDRAGLQPFVFYGNPDFRGPAPVEEDPDGALLAEAVHGHAANAPMQDFLREFQFRGDALAHEPEFTSDSFSPHAVAHLWREDLAVLSISGWYDGAYANGSISRFLGAPGGQSARDRRLLLGPWDHGARNNGSPYRAQQLPEFPVLAEILRFFDEHLAGRKTGLAEEAPVQLHVMAAERWEACPAWPPEEETRVLHLATGGLGEAPEAGALPLTVDYALGTGNQTRYDRLQLRDVRDYYPDWEERSAAMPTLAAEPLPAALAIAGHAVLHLVLTSDRKDACVFAYLEDIAPDGSRKYVTEGMHRALHRGGAAREDSYATTWAAPDCTRAAARPLVPGKAAHLEIPFLPVAWEFAAGHRIGLRLSGADRDNFALWPYGQPGAWEIGLGPQGSRLTLPVLGAP